MTFRDERGAVTTELVLVTPALIVLLLFVVLAGRLALVRGDVEGAARDAARAASIARSPSAAVEAARRAAADNLEPAARRARRLEVVPDTSDFRAGGTVAVDVTCHLPLGDLILLRVPATRSVQATAVEVLDVYRELDP